VKTILSDLEKDGVPMTFEQIKAAVDWYHGSWGYLHNVKAGVKRINLLGEERAVVTAAEERHSAQRLSDEKKRIKEEKEAGYGVNDMPVLKKPAPKKSPTPIPPPMLPAVVPASAPPVPTEDPFGYLLRIVEEARRAYQIFPEAMRRPMIAPTLRAIDAETQRLIADVEKDLDP
jgi:hypothetical protein